MRHVQTRRLVLTTAALFVGFAWVFSLARNA